MNKYTDSGLDLLIRAIAIQAANDFRSVFKRRLRKQRVSDEMSRAFDSAERFLESSDFSDIFNIDGTYITDHIINEERMKYHKELEKKRKQELKEERIKTQLIAS